MNLVFSFRNRRLVFSFGVLDTDGTDLTGKIITTVDSGTEKLDKLTQGEIEIYMEIVDCSTLIAEGAWTEVLKTKNAASVGS